MKKEIIYQGKIFSVERVRKKGKDGEIINFPKTVAIIPLISKNEIVLISQYRFPLRKYIWEIPAGKLEKGEKPEKGAERELLEETGFRPGKLERLSEFYISPGYSKEYMFLFKAINLRKENQFTIPKEELIREVKIFKLREVKTMIKEKKILDIKTILGISFLKNVSE